MIYSLKSTPLENPCGLNNCLLQTTDVLKQRPINKKWWGYGQANTKSTNSRVDYQELHLDCLFDWRSKVDCPQIILSRTKSIHSRPVMQIRSSPMDFIGELAHFNTILSQIVEKVNSYSFLFDVKLHNKLEDINEKIKALFSSPNKVESWIHVVTTEGYYEIYQKRNQITQLMYQVAIDSLNYIKKYVEEWKNSFDFLQMSSSQVETIKNREETTLKYVIKQKENLSRKQPRMIDGFIDSIREPIKLFIEDRWDKMIWRKVNDLRLEIQSIREEENEAEVDINNEIIELVIKALQRLDDDSSMKDHIRRAFDKDEDFSLQEDHFRDKLKDYLDGRNGFRVDSENVTKVDGLSDIRLIKGTHRRIISVKIWNRFSSDRDPIEQLLDDMGTGERTGFLLMVSDLRRDSIKEKYVDKFISSYKLSSSDDYNLIHDDDDIFVLKSEYERNQKNYTIIHVLIDTRQFLNKTL